MDSSPLKQKKLPPFPCKSFTFFKLHGHRSWAKRAHQKVFKERQQCKGKPCVLKPIINITSFEGWQWQSGRWRFFRVKECMESYADTNLVLVAVIALPVELKACNVNVRLSKFFASMETVQNVILCSVCNLKIIKYSCLHIN